VADRARLLTLEGPEHGASDLLRPERVETIHADSLPHLLTLLHEGPFAAYLISPNVPGLREQVGRFAQAEQILEALDIGVTLLDSDGRITWANGAFRDWCGVSPIGQDVMQALGQPQIREGDRNPFATARSGQSARSRLFTSRNSYLALHLAPLPGVTGRGGFFAQFRDITRRVMQKQKLDALHKAGSSLAGLEPELLDEMPVEQRIRLLKENLRRAVHEVLNYNVIEIRLLSRQSGKLEPLLAEGMTEEAAGRALYAKVDGNGVTGYVAATGESYLCADTAQDPHYIKGAEGARSSMTVPIKLGELVIGTFNVESPTPNAFGPDELQFAELFAREIAQALYTLELLSAQRYCAANESIKAVNREIALPVDTILNSATAILGSYLGLDRPMAENLRKIIEQARLIKANIQKVGDNLGPVVSSSAIDGLSPTRLKGKRVLMVDAEQEMRQAAHTVLEKLGCEVETAPTATQGLMLARECDYQAVMVDITPPDMKGYDAYIQFRDAQPKARMIMMAGFGYDGGHNLVKARQAGLKFVLFKPFLVNQLVAAIDGPEPPARPVCQEASVAF
jgi:two-component system, sensor histidine kinase SagS